VPKEQQEHKEMMAHKEQQEHKEMMEILVAQHLIIHMIFLLLQVIQEQAN
jgi:hypothetical protein